MSSSRAASISSFQWLAYATAQVLSNPGLGTLSGTIGRRPVLRAAARRVNQLRAARGLLLPERALLGAPRRHHGFLRCDVVDLQRDRR